mgnify:FL=1
MSILLQTIKKIFTKKNIFIFVLIVWVVFSAFYIVRAEWQRFQYNHVQAAYQKGSSDTVRLLIDQVEKCVRVPVQDGDKKIEVVKVNCSAQETPKKETVVPTPIPKP